MLIIKEGVGVSIEQKFELLIADEDCHIEG